MAEPELETFKVHVQRYLEETAVITVQAVDAEQAVTIGENWAAGDDVDWGPGDDVTSPDAYQVTDANGDPVWERTP